MKFHLLILTLLLVSAPARAAESSAAATFDRAAGAAAIQFEADEGWHLGPISLKVEWLACGSDECIPRSETFRFDPPEEPQESPQAVYRVSTRDTGSESADSLLTTILLAFAGGLLLNLMPCVLPVLAVKAAALSKSNKKSESLAYFAGVMASFAAIAAALVLLRGQAQTALGWGFQMQSPMFVSAMAVLFLTLGLMFLDAITLPFALKPAKGAFLSGVLAVAVAAPCAAPFMGAAVAYALMAPPSEAFPIFLSLGAGYALPFTFIGLFPIPKPGKWTLRLKKICAIPMFATAAWLLWILAAKPEENTVWQNYDETKIEALVRQGRPVFVNFTARWCLTCIANEKLALASGEFLDLAKQKNIALFRADWTTDSAVVAEALQKYGRGSVPLYVYHGGSESRSGWKILPQLLTPTILKEYLQ